MKKIIVILLFIIGIFSFNINVYAEGETPGETEPTSGEDEPTNPGDNPSNPGDDEPTEDDKLKSDATLGNVKINGIGVVCQDFVCKRIINDNDVTTAKIEYSLTNPKASVDKKSGQVINLLDGDNELEVKVTSEDETKTNTYKFIVTKKKLSTEATLKSLTVNGTEIALKEDVTEYSYSASHSTKKIEVEAIPTDEKAKVIDFTNNKASFDFYENSKKIKVIVQSEAGDRVTYIINATKRGEADVTLKSLTIKNHDIDFDSSITDYELKVLKNVDKLDITAKANSKNASVNIINPKLNVGENEVKIEVTNDGDKNTYIIKVTKLNEDDKTLANLKELTIENYEIDFKPDKYEYNLRIENENFLSIKALPKLEAAKVEVTGNLDLENGSIIKIKVIYDNEFYNVYKINITKEDGGVVNIDKVSKKAVILVMLFDVMSMIIIGIVQLFGRKNKNNKSDKDSKKSKKENNIVDNLNDEIIDII